MPPPDRDQTWVRDLSVRRGFAFTDLSTSDHQQLRLSGDLGPAGQRRPWWCVAHRAYLNDGGAEDWVEWTCPSLLALDRTRELSVGFGDGGAGVGGSGDAVGDLMLLGVGLVTSFLRRRKRPAGNGEVTDVLAVCEVSDPLGLFAGQVRELFAHWPAPDEPRAAWVTTTRRVLGVREYPPDAPPQPLWLGMSTRGPLSVTTREWWQRAPWLEHQIELGIAAGRAVVAAGAHADGA